MPAINALKAAHWDMTADVMLTEHVDDIELMLYAHGLTMNMGREHVTQYQRDMLRRARAEIVALQSKPVGYCLRDPEVCCDCCAGRLS